MAGCKRVGLLLGMMLLSFSVLSQQNRYMVFFKDKAGSAYNIMQPLSFLTPKAVDRRIRQSITISPEDLPVNTGYITAVKNTGASVFFTTRWMNGVLVQCNEAVIPAIQALACVDHVELVAPKARLIDNGRRDVVQRKTAVAQGAETQVQLEMLGIPQMHADNYIGQGMTVAIMDGGFSGVNVTAPFRHIIDEGRIDLTASRDFVFNSTNVFQYDDHGTEVFSVIAAYTADLFTGGAYKASFQLYVTEDVATEYRIEEYNWLFAAERADSLGVDIIHTSLGYYDFDMSSMNYTTAQMDGKTTVVTRAAQWAANRGMVVICSAGNEGNLASWRIIAAPADAIDILAVGNVNAQGMRHPTSSLGPSADGRVKPDVAALGTNVRVVRASGATGSALGTSLAAPLVTSLVAGVWQRYPQLTGKQVIEAVRKSASNVATPNNQIGYGIPHYAAIAAYLVRTDGAAFHVFPNPTADTVTITSQDPGTAPACNYELISAQGQVLAKDTATFTWQNKDYSLNLTSLQAGLYYLRVSYGQQQVTFKVVKL